MGNSFILVNSEKKEYITFLGYDKEVEIIGNDVTAKMATFYLFNNNGDDVYFVGDQWQVGIVFANVELIFKHYKDVTFEYLRYMVEEDYLNLEELKSFTPWIKESMIVDGEKS